MIEINEQFRDDINAYHVGSRVMVGGRKTFVTQSPYDDAKKRL